MEDLHYNIYSTFAGSLFETGHTHQGLLIKHSSDTWELHAWMCSGKMDIQYSLFSHLSLALVFFQSNFTVSWCVLLFSSSQSDVYAGLNTDLNIDFQPHRKKGAAVQKYWVGLINTYWLCWADCFFLVCGFVFSLHMKCVSRPDLEHLFWPG